MKENRLPVSLTGFSKASFKIIDFERGSQDKNDKFFPRPYLLTTKVSMEIPVSVS
jgi:hypothetical protein